MNEEAQYVWIVNWDQRSTRVFRTRLAAERWLKSEGAASRCGGGNWALWHAIDEDGDVETIYLDRAELES
jgi:hypothetical protein